jgi:FkbM family methyltransferase
MENVLFDLAYSLVDYYGYTFLTDNPMGQRMINGQYETEELSLINKIPAIEDMRVLELGGCLGVVSVAVNTKLNNPENHIVVEANPNVIEYLENNREINHCKFKIENIIVSSRSDGTFYSFDKLVAGSSHRRQVRGEHNKTKHIIKTMSLQELMDTYDTEFDLIVMDIEGGELEFLEDMGDISVKYILVELHEFMMYRGFNTQCTKTLEKRGMSLVARKGNSFLYGVHRHNEH